ncbi:MAG: hypothetical protein EBR09_10380 [Proteobacteria bacterium]|nr:hypothetical protein [Pseudomonadota bacterium]
MSAKVQTGRVPYTVSYRTSDGELKTIRRVPPPVMHEFKNEDTVTITRKRGDDWDAGQEVKVIGINSRQPNTLMVEGNNGKHTFLTYTDVRGVPKNAADQAITEDFQERQSDPLGSDYLLWP